MKQLLVIVLTSVFLFGVLFLDFATAKSTKEPNAASNAEYGNEATSSTETATPGMPVNDVTVGNYCTKTDDGREVCRSPPFRIAEPMPKKTVEQPELVFKMFKLPNKNKKRPTGRPAGGRCRTYPDGRTACVGTPLARDENGNVIDLDKMNSPATNTPKASGRCTTTADGHRACVGTPLARDENGNVIDLDNPVPTPPAGVRCWKTEDGGEACVGTPQRSKPVNPTSTSSIRCWKTEDGGQACETPQRSKPVNPPSTSASSIRCWKTEDGGEACEKPQTSKHVNPPSTSSIRCWKTEDGGQACSAPQMAKPNKPAKARCWTTEDGNTACVGTPLVRDENGNVIPPAEMTPQE